MHFLFDQVGQMGGELWQKYEYLICAYVHSTHHSAHNVTTVFNTMLLQVASIPCYMNCSFISIICICVVWLFSETLKEYLKVFESAEIRCFELEVRARNVLLLARARFSRRWKCCFSIKMLVHVTEWVVIGLHPIQWLNCVGYAYDIFMYQHKIFFMKSNEYFSHKNVSDSER